MPHTKEQKTSKGLQMAHGIPIDTTSNTVHTYTSYTTSRRGTTVCLLMI